MNLPPPRENAPGVLRSNVQRTGLKPHLPVQTIRYISSKVCPLEHFRPHTFFFILTDKNKNCICR